MSRIELQNRNGDIEYCTVSPEHFDQLNQFKWRKNAGGYIQKHSNDGTNTLMHRFVMAEILGYDLSLNGFVVNHIDRDRSNNTKENLEWIPRAKNSENASKSKNASSKYYGVSKVTRNHKVTYRVDFKVDKNTRLRACYKNEIHAAHEFNLWSARHGRTGDRINIIEIPDNFKEWKKREKKDQDLPEGITRRGDKFRIRPTINGTRVNRLYDLLEEAKSELNRLLHEEKDKKIQLILDTPILKKEGQCIIEMFNIKKEKVGETVVDEDMYYLLKMFPIHLSLGKAIILVNGKKMLLSRYVIDYDGEWYVDHIGTHNPLNALDNRKENLRIVDARGNAQNRRSLEGSSSKHIGVCKIGDKTWVSYITVNGKGIYLGCFDNEEEAAEKRDMATIKYFGEFGHLNFPENVYNHFAILSPRLSCLVHHLHEFCSKQIYLGDFDEKKVKNNFGEFDHLNLPENKYNNFAVLNMRLSYYLVEKK